MGLPEARVGVTAVGVSRVAVADTENETSSGTSSFASPDFYTLPMPACFVSSVYKPSATGGAHAARALGEGSGD